MFKTGKCPKCEKVPASLEVENIDISAGFGQTQWVGATILCPYCKTILGAGIDQISIKADTVKEVLRGLGKT